MKRHEEVDVVLPGKTLSIPKTKEELDDLESTLLALYELKVKETYCSPKVN